MKGEGGRKGGGGGGKAGKSTSVSGEEESKEMEKEKEEFFKAIGYSEFEEYVVFPKEVHVHVYI